MELLFSNADLDVKHQVCKILNKKARYFTNGINDYEIVIHLNYHITFPLSSLAACAVKCLFTYLLRLNCE